MLRSIGHEGDVLEAEYTNGKVYRYEGISAAQYGELLAADSVGGHFNKHIRGAACTACTRVGGDETVETETTVD